MEQNINLLRRPALLARHGDASLKSFTLLVVGFCVLLMGIYFISLGVYKKDETNLARLVLEQKDVSQQITVLMKQIAQQNIATSSGVAITTAGQPAAQFVPYLKKLGIYTPHGIWFDSFSFSQKEGVFIFVLHGKAIAATLLPQFMKIIDEQYIFNGEKLINLTLQKDEKTNLISFVLNNSESLKR